MKSHTLYRIALLLILKICSAFCGEIQFQIIEESPVDTVVGRLLKTVFPSTSQSDQLTILNGKDKAVNCFKINERGDLLVARKIDRDVICKKLIPDPSFSIKSETSLVEECKVTIQVASQMNNMIIPVIIIIDDKNDNAPQWTQDRIDIRLIDGSKERTKVPLPTAYDDDVGENAQIEYTIKERDLPFRINNIDGLYLETLQVLDRESKEMYKFTIVATDKGHPARSTEIEADLTIEDINDNNPMFTKTIYRFKSISENSAVGTVVGKLEATDADSGVNGKFHFTFSKSVSGIVKLYFSVNLDGTVTVNSPLDCDHGESQYKFKVIVEDEALRPYSRSSEASVVITIDDVNDETPELKFVFMNRDPRSNNPFITEHSKIGTLIGILEVNDADFKGSDIVSCRDSPYFSLLHEDRQTKYKIVTNVEFDREKKSEVMLMIVCTDGVGNRASKNQTIVIRDINDNPPMFTRHLYEVKIKENMPVNTKLSEKVHATDPDSDSVIEYSIMKEFEVNFAIDKRSGVISSRATFDREECESYTIKVLATDATKGIINTGTSTVKVIITDENDNKPTFTQESYNFHISENNSPSTPVGTIEATDLDSSDQQRTLKYYLGNSPSSQHFQINHRTGSIVATTNLDREKIAHYVLPVTVVDGQTSQSRRHTTTSTVTVTVDDVNDNSPRFIQPNSSRHSFDISIKETGGHKITYILADDPDDGDNARITYSITLGNDLALFSLDPSSGLLLLNQNLQSQNQIPPLAYSLTVSACDAGKPRALCTEFKGLKIMVKNGKGGFLHNTDTIIDTSISRRTNAVPQEAIMICLAIVFVILLVSCAALIILMKYKPMMWCRRSRRANSKDKRFESCANSQMLPTIDGNVNGKDIDDSMRNFCSENLIWQSNGEHMQPKMGNFSVAIDHTRPDYQTLESLCLATSMRSTHQPRFVDPCSRTQTLIPCSMSTSFLSNHDSKRTNQHPTLRSDMMLAEGQHHIYQSVEDDNAIQHFYSKLNDTKKGSKYNINNHNINQISVDQSNKDSDANKYGSYMYNEASFV